LPCGSAVVSGLGRSRWYYHTALLAVHLEPASDEFVAKSGKPIELAGFSAGALAFPESGSQRTPYWRTGGRWIRTLGPRFVSAQDGAVWHTWQIR